MPAKKTTAKAAKAVKDEIPQLYSQLPKLITVTFLLLE